MFQKPVIRFLSLVLLLIATGAGCSSDESPTSVGSSSTKTGIDFEMAVSGYDFSIYLDGSYLGRLDSKGDKIHKDLATGTYRFHIVDNVYDRTSKEESFSIIANHRRTITFGVGGEEIEWLVDAVYGNLSTSIDHDQQVIYIGTTLKVYDSLIGRTMAQGKYWLKKSGDSYTYFTASGHQFDTPGNYVGDMSYVTPRSGSQNLYYQSSIPFSYSCFPDRSDGATYYAIAKLYERSSVTSVNASTITRIGPPQTIVRITWSKIDKNSDETIPIAEEVPFKDLGVDEDVIFGVIEQGV